MTTNDSTRLNAARYQSITDIEAELRAVLPWLTRPGFRINTHEGFDGSAFGARAGPRESISAVSVIHEVSHALEMTLLPEAVWKRRVRRPQFDMRIRSYQDIGFERIYEPVTLQATKRECRVGGIQLRLLEAAGYDTSTFIERYVLSLKYMADCIYGGRCPLNVSDRARFTKKHWKWIAKRTQWVHDSYNQFSLAELQDRWATVMDWIARFQTNPLPQSIHKSLIAA